MISSRCVGNKTDSQRRKRPSLKRPSSSLTTDAQRRMVDISGLDYKTHRHWLIEATLRKQYDDYQPPGDVVLNSLHLNSADSVIGVRLNDRYDHSLFDFVEKYYDTSKETSWRNVGHHPLDHFLIKSSRRPKTAEMQTETLPDRRESSDRAGARGYLPPNADSHSPRSPDNNGNPRAQSPPRRSVSIEDNVVVARNDLNSRSEAPRGRSTIPRVVGAIAENSSTKEDRARRKSSPWTAKNRSSSAGSASTTGALTLFRAATLPESRRLIKPPGRSARKDQSKRTTLATKNVPSRSSSDVVSVRSKHSAGEHRDEMSCRSRESSVSPKNPKSRPPWLFGDRGGSFNRKYGNIAKDPSRIGRPMSTRGGSLPRKLAVPRGGKEPSSTPVRRHNPTLVRPRAASFIAPREKEFIGPSAEEEEEEQDLTATTFSRRQRDKSDVGSVALENDGRTRLTRTPGEGISARKAISRFLDNAASSRTRACATASRPPQASSANASRTSATKKARSGKASGDTRNTKSPLDQPAYRAKLNRGQRAANSAKGASLSSKIELSDRVLNSADDTGDERELPAKLGKRSVSRENVGGTSDGDAVLSVKNPASTTTRNDVSSNNTSCVARSKEIIPNTRASDLVESRKPALSHSSTARRNANSGTKSGLSGTKLNARSNDPLDKMKRSSAGSAVLRENSITFVGEAKAHERDVTAGEEELKLPRHDSKIGLAMNSALRRYIKTLKQGLLDRGNKDGIALATLSLTDAISILSGQRAPLSVEELRELQGVLSKVERNPELLCGESLSSVENAA